MGVSMGVGRGVRVGTGTGMAVGAGLGVEVGRGGMTVGKVPDGGLGPAVGVGVCSAAHAAVSVAAVDLIAASLWRSAVRVE